MMSVSNDRTEMRCPNTPTKGLISFITVAGILGFTAGMIWYNFSNNQESRNRKRIFKRMKQYRISTLRDYT